MWRGEAYRRAVRNRWWRPLVALTTVTGLLLAGCGTDESAAPDEPPATVATTTTTQPTTTTEDPAPEPACGLDEVLAVVDATLELARLDVGGEWVTGVESVYSERTTDPATYAGLLGLDCGLEAVQRPAASSERLLLAAWTGPRITFVVQATDGPSEPYEPAAMWDVSIAWARGEYFEGPVRANRDDRTTWATTLDDGTTMVIHARDYPAGPVAKDWPAGLEFQEPEEYVSLPAERHGIDTLRAVGARNVDVAELPEIGSEIGYLSFVTPLGLAGETRVAPLGWIDVTTEWHGRPVAVEQLGGVDVYLSEPGPPDDADILTYDLAHFTFECGEHVWHMITAYGTVEELRDLVAELIAVQEC